MIKILTSSPAVARVGLTYRCYQKASVWLLIAIRKWFPGVTTVTYTLRWRCYRDQ